MKTEKEVEDIIVRTVSTFPMGSPIIIDDIKFAARVDGTPIDDVSSKEIVWFLRKICDMESRGRHDRASWFRRNP